MLKEMLISKFETYLLDEEMENQEVEELVHEEMEQLEQYPPGFFSAL